MKKRVGEIEEFAFGQLYGGVVETKDGVTVVTTPQLDITIAISGWIKDERLEGFVLLFNLIISLFCNSLIN